MRRSECRSSRDSSPEWSKSDREARIIATEDGNSVGYSTRPRTSQRPANFDSPVGDRQKKNRSCMRPDSGSNRSGYWATRITDDTLDSDDEWRSNSTGLTPAWRRLEPRTNSIRLNATIQPGVQFRTGDESVRGAQTGSRPLAASSVIMGEKASANSAGMMNAFTIPESNVRAVSREIFKTPPTMLTRTTNFDNWWLDLKPPPQ
jgi:hypothetical protein